MDPIVDAALRKWPNVPHVYGWLALDARGHWHLRDAAAQAAGPFPRVRGSRIDHERLLAFIGRNYAADADGGWFFQNGPQRVYVDLEAAPWVWRLQPGTPIGLRAHTGQEAIARSAWLDDAGRLFIEADLGFGLVHSLDTELAAQALEAGQWPLHEQPFSQLPKRFGYRLAPRPPK